ncbi:Acetyltransferase (GNAT) family protein [Fulvimarina manganoxydans]|uniref:Acetyltransferase (GNAT) family protein n=1 Tax=Fulvimarina manganoxydans TaxID=937218 RepID=A0A1W1YCL5_9HYPH|nr:GNAT family N-acetyltransferase [Fulvimarina manganoxydans]SMC33864.1 Acetyltransferase (GNAT) family protein [Fulvimarina manganoxydans]
MAITEADSASKLAVIRRLEAVGFRAFPATHTVFDGTWAVRLTPAFPAKRLNSVNPLDPSDHARIAERVQAAERRFAEAGRSLVFRLSPLASPELVAFLDDAGFRAFDETLVMTCDLEKADFADLVDRIPIHDVQRYVAASLAVHERPASLGNGLQRILEDIAPQKAMFVRQEACGSPEAVALAINERELAGILDVAVAKSRRGHGIGRDLVRTALRHVHLRGAKTAWVQVEADNEAGLRLYRSLGFSEAYRYIYRARFETERS